MIGVNESLRKLRSRIVLQVHDELLIETFAEEEEEVREILEREMEHVSLSCSARHRCADR